MCLSAQAVELIKYVTLKIPAAQNGRLVRMDGQSLLGFGPRTADTIRTLSEAFYEGHAE